MFKLIARAIAIAAVSATAVSATTAVAAPVEYTFSGSLTWSTGGDPGEPGDIQPAEPPIINFNGAAFLDNNLSVLTNAATFINFDNLDIGPAGGPVTTFNANNVDASLITNGGTDNPFTFSIGGVSADDPQGNTNDFLAVFKVDSLSPFNFVNQAPLSFEIRLAQVILANSDLSDTQQFDNISGTITFTRVTNTPTPIPVPAAAPLFVAGVAAFGFVKRRRKKRVA